jgi:UDP-2-acetamido-3-amino-2,3-dideoxy-glucuronate N-acetyltransferase
VTDLADLGVGRTRLVQLSRIAAENGELIVGDDPHLPFAARRFFVLQNIPGGEARGTHAHRRCEQFLVCLRGAVTALVDDGRTSREVRLDDPAVGLYMPELTWGTQKDYSDDALLLVLASEPYDADDYIHDYSEFQALAGV